MIGSHIIPRCYLEKFAIKRKPSAKTGHFWIYSKASPARQGTPKSEGVENGYFGFPLSSGELDESLEQELATIESEAGEVLVLATNPCFVWSSKYRRAMASYVGLLFARARGRHEGSDIIAERYCKRVLSLLNDDAAFHEASETWTKFLGKPVSAGDLRNQIERSAKSFLAPNGKKQAFLYTLHHLAKSISKILLDKQWQLWRVPTGIEFVASDNPVVPAAHINGDFLPGFGFRQPGVVVFLPLG